MRSFANICLLLCTTLITGCAVNTGIIETEPNKYMVSRQAATGFTGKGNLKEESIKEAAAYCTSKKRHLQIINVFEAQPPYILGNFPKAEIQFTCLQAAEVGNMGAATVSNSSFEDDLQKAIKAKSKGKNNPNLYVLSIGISDYADVPPVPFADRSAIQFSEMAISALGANPENVITLTDKQATSGRIRGRFRTLLNRLEAKDQLVVYFAGHGVPSKDGKAAYLLAQDGGPGSFEETDFELGYLYEQIARSRVGEASIFIDACFSGRSSKDSIIFDGVAPISVAKKRTIDQTGRVSIITAGKGDQFANQYKSRGHRLFGYHLMKTLLEETSSIKSSDLYAKVREKVLSDSRRLGPEFEQEPELLGNPNIQIFAK